MESEDEDVRTYEDGLLNEMFPVPEGPRQGDAMAAHGGSGAPPPAGDKFVVELPLSQAPAVASGCEAVVAAPIGGEASSSERSVTEAAEAPNEAPRVTASGVSPTDIQRNLIYVPS